MPRVIPYEQQATPQGFEGTQASAAAFGGGTGLSDLARGVTTAGETMYDVEGDREVANIHAKMSQARMDWTQKMQDRQGQAQPGDMTFAPKINEELTDYFSQMGENLTTRKGRDAFTKLSASLQTSLVDKAISFQGQLAGEQAKVDALQTRQNNSNTLMMDPAQYGPIVEQDKAIIGGGFGNYGHLDQAQRSRLVMENQQNYAWAASYSIAEKNPAGFLQSVAPDAAAQRINGVAIGGVPSGSKGSFDTAVATLLAKEGGYNAKDGNSNAPVNFGINQRANPDIDVKNLTREKAVELYRTRYWNQIGGDNLPAPVALFALDAAANMGVDAAKKLVASGGTIEQMAEQRKQMYKDIAAANPQQAKFLNGWLARTDKAAAEASQSAPAPLAIQVQNNPELLAKDVPAVPGWADLPVEKKIALIGHAETRQNQIMAVNKAQLEQSWKNQSSQAMTTGEVASPIPQSQFIQSYGAAEGTRKYNEEYLPMLQLGANVKAAYGATTAQQDATLEAMKPVPNTPGFASSQSRYEAYAQAVNLVRQQRTADPIQFAMNSKIQGIAALDMSTPDKMADGVAARVAPAKALQQSFGTQPAYLSKPEAEGMQRALGQMPTSQKLAYLDALRTKVNDGEAFKTVIQQITPDSPVTLAAASLLAKQDPMVINSHWFKADETAAPKEVAGIVLEGESLLNKSKGDKKQDGTSRGFPMPKEELLRMEFNNQIGNAFAGMPGAADTAYQAVRAYYAGKSARTGNLASKEEPDSKLISEAVKAVTGGVYEQNGAKVLMPWGMSEDKFKPALQASFTQAAAANGITGHLADVGKYGFQGIGDGKYLVKSGTDFLKSPVNGQPIVLDVYNAPTTMAPGGVTPAAGTTKVAVGGRSHGGKIKY